jgi:hypothetical protein
MGDPAATGDTDEATLPAFEAAAAEIEMRVALLITDLTTTRAPGRVRHA